MTGAVVVVVAGAAVVVVAGAAVVVVVATGGAGTPATERALTESSVRCTARVPGPEIPSTVAPSSCCKRRTRSLFSPQTKVAVRMAEAGTAKAAIVVVAAVAVADVVDGG